MRKIILAKIIYPETGEPETRDNIRISKRRTFANVFDGISSGASEGMKVAINVTATATEYVFACEEVNFKCRFTSPLVLNDMLLVSRPCTYVDFEIEGDDIIYLCRTAINRPRTYHDSNYSTFHRIKNFREIL